MSVRFPQSRIRPDRFIGHLGRRIGCRLHHHPLPAVRTSVGATHSLRGRKPSGMDTRRARLQIRTRARSQHFSTRIDWKTRLISERLQTRVRTRILSRKQTRRHVAPRLSVATLKGDEQVDGWIDPYTFLANMFDRAPQLRRVVGDADSLRHGNQRVATA